MLNYLAVMHIFEEFTLKKRGKKIHTTSISVSGMNGKQYFQRKLYYTIELLLFNCSAIKIQFEFLKTFSIEICMYAWFLRLPSRAKPASPALTPSPSHDSVTDDSLRKIEVNVVHKTQCEHTTRLSLPEFTFVFVRHLNWMQTYVENNETMFCINYIL